MENKSSFCFIIINQEWVSIVEVSSEDGEKKLIYVIFKKLNIKPAWIELIKNIDNEAEK